MTVAMFLLSGIGVVDADVAGGLYMLVLGLGLGMTMQVLVLAAQNAVPYRAARRRHLRLDALPADRRLDRRRALRRDLREPARDRARRRPSARRRAAGRGEPRDRRGAPAGGHARTISTHSPPPCGPVFAVAAGSLARRASRSPGSCARCRSGRSAAAEGITESFAMPREAESLPELRADRHDARPPREPLAGLRPACAAEPASSSTRPSSGWSRVSARARRST